MMNLRFLFIVSTIIYSHFSAAAHEVTKFYVPGEYERARRAKAVFDDDKESVDAALEVVLRLLDIKVQGTEHITDAATYLQEMVSIHTSYKFGTKVRSQKLRKLRQVAQDSYLRHIKKRFEREDRIFMKEIEALETTQTVKNFLTHYFNGIHDYERLMASGTAAVGIGLSTGCGLGILTYPNGDRSLAVCASLGLACFWGGDVSLEHHQGTSDSGFTTSWRYHFARIFGCSSKVVDRRKRYRGYKFMLDKAQEGQGLAIGVGDLEVHSVVVDVPVAPFFSDYGFARQLLGINYPSEL